MNKNTTQLDGKQNCTTAEDAARMCRRTVRGFSTTDMLVAIADIRVHTQELVSYLTHPEVLVGLAEGRFGPTGLKRRLALMEQADSGEGIDE